MTYAVHVSDDAGRFTIGTTGDMLLDTSDLDYESLKSQGYKITMTIRVTDDAVNCQFPSESHPAATYGDATYIVHVRDVQEAPTLSNAQLSIKENSPHGTFIGEKLLAHDDDNTDLVGLQDLTYAIVKVQRRSWLNPQDGLTDVSNNYFDVVSTMGVSNTIGYGQLQVNRTLDYELYDQYVVLMRVVDTDGDGKTHFATDATVTIGIVNVNEAPYRKPSVEQPIIEIYENTDITTEVSNSFQSIFWDPDSPLAASTDYLNEPLVYSITASLPDDSTLGLPTTDILGVLKVDSNINFESSSLLAGNSYTLTITATDSGWDGEGAKVGTGTVTVHVLNINEVCTLSPVVRNVPQHTKAQQLNSLIPRWTNNGATPTYVGSPIIAQDVDTIVGPRTVDSQSPQVLSYVIVGGNLYNSANGNIDAVFKFSTLRLGQIVVNDPGVACSTDPTEKDARDNVAEQCGTRTNDPAIQFDATQTGAPYQYTLRVRATDNGINPAALSCEADITVEVTDVNEKPYFVDPANPTNRVTSYAYEISENNLGNSHNPPWSVAVKAADAEIGADTNPQTVSYTWEARNPDGSSCATSAPNVRSAGCDVEFTVETTGAAGVDGIITMVGSDPPALDYESHFKIYLAVTVTDTHESKQSSTALVVITVTDVNEPPILPTTVIALTIREDAVALTQVVPLPKVMSDAIEDRLDVDVDDPTIPEGQVRYSWTSSSGGVAATAFALQSLTHIVTVSEALNFETKSTYSFLVTAKDKSVGTCLGSSSSSFCASGTRAVVVTVSDVNEPPEITRIDVLELKEDASAGQLVATTTASDPDTSQIPATLLTYSILSRFNGLFNMNSTSGDISVASSSSLDYEQVTQFSLAVTVRDNGLVSPHTCSPVSGSPPSYCVQTPECAAGGRYCLSATASATVIVSDVNDVEITKITNKNGGVPVSYNTRGGEEVVIEGINFGTKPGTNPAVSGETYHTYSVAYTPTITATYGGNEGRTYTATNCAIAERNSKIVCQTTEGTGANHQWRVTVDGHESPLSPLSTAYTSYSSPSLVSVTIPEPGTLPTIGGTTVSLNGDFFGPPVADCLSLNGEKGCPDVWYDVTYTLPLYPSTLVVSESTKHTRYNAVQCRVVSHTEIQCDTVEGSGMQLKWDLEIADQGSNFVIHGNHTQPMLSRARYIYFERSCIGTAADSFNDGLTNDSTIITLAACQISCTLRASCRAVQWNDLAKTCQRKTTSVLSVPSACANDQDDVYAPTLATDGSTQLRLLGTNLGPAGGDLFTLTANYGPSPKGIEPYAPRTFLLLLF